MERCPTCGARHAGGPSCHRCRTDLGQVLAIERAAARHRRQARAALSRGARAAARAHAARACALHRSPESVTVLAVAALADRDFPAALRLLSALTGGSGLAIRRTVLNDVRNAADAIENFPPPNVERPRMELARLTSEVTTLAIPSPVAGEDDLRLAAETVRRELLERPSVPLATLSQGHARPGDGDRVERSNAPAVRNGASSRDRHRRAEGGAP